MKLFFTPLFNAKKLAIALFFSLPFVANAQFLLNQDFNASTALSDYQGIGANQFDSIKVSAPSGSNLIYFSGNRLTIQRYGGNGIFSKSTNLSATDPTFLRIKFKLNVPFNSIPALIPQSQAVFYVGSSINAGTSTTSPLTEVRYASCAIGFGSNTKFYLRSTVAPFVNTVDTLVGEQQINWYLNNSGASVVYKDPTGVDATLADDQYDLWIGNTRVFAAMPVVTPTSTMNQFKFLFNGAIGGGISFDDFEITTGVNALPVAIASFKATIDGSSNQLTWATASEINNKGFYVQRQSKTGDSWDNLGFVNGNNKASTYTFSDNSPFVTSFYRLRQVDVDGKESFSKVVSINQKLKGKILISPNPTTNKVTINLNHITASSSTATVVLYDLTGKKVLVQNSKAGTFELDLSHLAKGIYNLTVQTENTTYNEKIIKQ